MREKNHVFVRKGKKTIKWWYKKIAIEKNKFKLGTRKRCIAKESLTASTLLHRLVLSIELSTVKTGTGKVILVRKLKCTTAARVHIILNALKTDEQKKVLNVYISATTLVAPLVLILRTRKRKENLLEYYRILKHYCSSQWLYIMLGYD